MASLTPDMVHRNQSPTQNRPQRTIGSRADSAPGHGYMPADGLSGAVVAICIGRLPGRVFMPGGQSYGLRRPESAVCSLLSRVRLGH